MTPFGNDDLIDQRNRERIRKLEARNHELESGLRVLVHDFNRSTSMSLAEKDQAIRQAQRMLEYED